MNESSESGLGDLLDRALVDEDRRLAALEARLRELGVTPPAPTPVPELPAQAPPPPPQAWDAPPAPTRSQASASPLKGPFSELALDPPDDELREARALLAESGRHLRGLEAQLHALEERAAPPPTPPLPPPTPSGTIPRGVSPLRADRFDLEVAFGHHKEVSLSDLARGQALILEELRILREAIARPEGEVESLRARLLEESQRRQERLEGLLTRLAAPSQPVSSPPVQSQAASERPLVPSGPPLGPLGPPPTPSRPPAPWPSPEARLAPPPPVAWPYSDAYARLPAPPQQASGPYGRGPAFHGQAAQPYSSGHYQAQPGGPFPPSPSDSGALRARLSALGMEHRNLVQAHEQVLAQLFSLLGQPPTA